MNNRDLLLSFGPTLVIVSKMNLDDVFRIRCIKLLVLSNFTVRRISAMFKLVHEEIGILIVHGVEASYNWA